MSIAAAMGIIGFSSTVNAKTPDECPEGIEKITPDIQDIYLVSRVETEERATQDPKTPRIGQKTWLSAIVKAEIDGETIYFSDTKNININGQRISNADKQRWDSCLYGDLSVSWFKVEPVDRYYENATLGGDWLGWDIPEYVETKMELTDMSIIADNLATVVPDANGLGTMRYKVEINYNGETFATAGKDAKTKDGISDDVHRISVRGDTGNNIIDWGMARMQLPFIMGSASITGKDKGHQSENYQGADCADFVAAAARDAGYNIPFGWSGSFIPRAGYTKSIVGEDIRVRYSEGIFYNEDEFESEAIVFGEDGVKQGDIVLYNRHVGILAEDKGIKGILDIDDLVLHTLFAPPVLERLATAFSGAGGINGIVRLKDAYLE